MHAVRRRLTAWLCCALLTAGVLFSAWFLVREVRHACTGAGCPTCACLQAAARQLRAGARPKGTVSLPRPALRAVSPEKGTRRERPAATLVAHKVRLDN